MSETTSQRGALMLALGPPFYTAVRPVFGGRMDQAQVAGVESIVQAWNVWVASGLAGPAPVSVPAPVPTLAWLAYMLATAAWETAWTMRPIEEIGRGRGRAYGIAVAGRVYYGRGYVQLTWQSNYRRLGQLLGIPLEANPALALNPAIAAQIMIQGMTGGLFTGRALDDYFAPATATSPTRNDPVGARAIINGSDKATRIGALHRQFLAALRTAIPAAAGVS